MAGADENGFEDALKIAADADLVLLTLGGKHGTCSMATMGEGVDATNINLPACQDAFIREVSKLGKPIVGVHFDGRPISSDVADNCLNAILEAWSPAECGAEAVAGALVGDYSPGGKLPISVAYTAGQIPVYYNHPNGSAWHQGESIGFVNYMDMPHKPRYCFGHGLSYAEFKYDNFSISSEKISPQECLIVEMDVTNAGDMEADEVVQLYMSDIYASQTRPVQELIGFIRVHVMAGDKKHIRFQVHPSQLAFLDKDMKWKIEKGAYEIRIGSSSEDIRYVCEITVTENAWIDGKMRDMCAKAVVGEVYV